MKDTTLTYAKCQELWTRVTDPSKGRTLPRGGYARLFKNKNNSFTVREMPGRGRSTRRPAEGLALFTITPQDRYTIHHTPYYYDDMVIKRFRLFLPLQDDVARLGYYRYSRLTVPAPSAARKPAEPKVEAVRYPFYYPKSDSRRNDYEAMLKKFGTMDKWYAAHQKYEQARSRYRAKLSEWQASQTIEIGEGLVLDSKGSPSQNSVATMQAKQRAAERAEEARRKRELAEWEKRNRAMQRERIKQQRELLTAEKKALVELKKLHPDLKNIKDGALAKFLVENKVKLTGKTATMYKAVQSDNRSFRAGQAGYVKYEVGKTVECPDYNTEAGCTNGLFFWPSEATAKQYLGRTTAGKIIECEVDLATMVLVYREKVKVKSCKVIKEVK